MQQPYICNGIKVFYSAANLPHHSYLCALMRADELFSEGLDKIPHGRPDKQYQDALAGNANAFDERMEADRLQLDIDADDSLRAQCSESAVL